MRRKKLGVHEESPYGLKGSGEDAPSEGFPFIAATFSKVASILADGGRLGGASSEGAAKGEAEQTGEGSSSGKDRPGLGEGGSQRKGKGGMGSGSLGRRFRREDGRRRCWGNFTSLQGASLRKRPASSSR
jgi:hypothetical protein